MPAELARYEMPEYARRSIALVGVAGPADGALGVDAFGRADGHYLEMLMRRLDAPIASRWLSIALRRALMSKVHTPHGVNGADFAAERAWLLLRMGESVAARAVVQSVDTEDYTPKLYQIAMQAALATGDPAGLCPLADAAVTVSPERGWVLAQAMCAGLAGQPAKAQPLIAAARKTGVAGGIDLLLAQKVAGAGSPGTAGGDDRMGRRRSADGVAIWPRDRDRRRNSRQLCSQRSGPTCSPGVPCRLRSSPGYGRVAADQAAVRGVFSNAALVDLYGAIDADDDQSTRGKRDARDLRTAYTRRGLAHPPRCAEAALGRTDDARWALCPADPDGAGRGARSGRCRATRYRPARRLDADRRIRPTAMRWRAKAPKGSDAWAMLALADPDRVTFSYGRCAGAIRGRTIPTG